MSVNKSTSSSYEAEYSVPISKLLMAICAIAPVSMLFGMIAYKADWSITQIFL